MVLEHMLAAGLYQVNDMDSKAQMNLPRNMAYLVDTQREGETGNESRTDIHGNHSATMCIPARRFEMPLIPGCTAAPGIAGPDGMVLSAHCHFGDSTTTIRKLDAKTWRFDTVMTTGEAQVAPFAGAGLAGMRAMLESTLRQGTPEERRFAAEKLKQLPALEHEMVRVEAMKTAPAPQIAQGKAMAAKKGIVFDARQPLLQNKSSYTITRIADSCGATKP